MCTTQLLHNLCPYCHTRVPTLANHTQCTHTYLQKTEPAFRLEFHPAWHLEREVDKVVERVTIDVVCCRRACAAGTG